MSTQIEQPSFSRLLSEDEKRLAVVKQQALDAVLNPPVINIENFDVDKASDAEMREAMKVLLADRARNKAKELEPLGIDGFEGLPIFLDKAECTRCRQFANMRPDAEGKMHRVCHDCNELIEHNQALGNNGLESITVDHLHIHTVRESRGRQIRIPARRELCIPCFRIDFKKVYPDTACPF
jgi:hypothetical protein